MFGYSIHGDVFTPEDTIVKNILREMWKYNQTYSLGSSVRLLIAWIFEFSSTFKNRFQVLTCKLFAFILWYCI